MSRAGSGDPLLLRRLTAVEKQRLGVSSSVGPTGAAGPAGPAFQFPVGSIFMAVVATNPASLLGYGTWAALAPGRVLIGDNGGTYPAGATGGVETATTSIGDTATPGAGAGVTAVSTAVHVHTVSVVQPYLVVYMWSRSA